MRVEQLIKVATTSSIKEIYNVEEFLDDVVVSPTKPEFTGDYTIVLFSYVKQFKQSPETIGQAIGEHLLTSQPDFIASYNVIKGFLNLELTPQFWLTFLQSQSKDELLGVKSDKRENIIVEYSSPNTNKPLHLGHLRNNFLGWSIAEMLKSVGNNVVKTCIVNDRGIHICKSMIAWKLFANDSTPSSAGMKGDHFVGDYYVKFNDAYKSEVNELVSNGMSQEMAEKEAPIMKATQQMLLDWEEGKPEVLELWETMNSWVYEGFEKTYQTIGSDFFKTYYESNTYLLGKDLVEKGLESNVFYKKEDGSVWIDLTSEGMDEKLVRRKDGTSVYITQDIGLAEQKQKEFNADRSIYVVGDEQNYHFKVLKIICQKLQLPSSDGIFHLSYGMVELPTGKMKSREGTVVDADDIIQEMIEIAKKRTEELGKVKEFSEAELTDLYHTIGLGALKFFLLRVDPKKKMIFNPEESIDFHGFTGPFIQYTHARIKSILKKLDGDVNTVELNINGTLLPLEKEIIILLEQFPTTLELAVKEYDPSKIAVYTYNVAKTFNTFYNVHSILNAESVEKQILRSAICQLTATTIQKGMSLLGIKVPERM